MQDEEKEEKEVSDEVWAKRAAARQRQIDIGKARREYECFTEAVPDNERCGYHPHTPDPKARVSKRAFDRLLSTWRRQLHDFDFGDKTMMALTPATDSTRADSEAGASPPSANSACMDNQRGSQFSNGECREQEEVSRRLQLAALLPGPHAVGQPSGGPPRRSSTASSGANSPQPPNPAVAMLSSMAMTPQQFSQAPAMGLHQWASPVRLPSYAQPQANMPAMASFVPTCPWTPQTAWTQSQSIPMTHGSFWQQQQQQQQPNSPAPLNTSHSSSSSIRFGSKETHDESESKDRPKSPQSPKGQKPIDVKEPSTPPSKTQTQAFSSPVHKVHNRSPSSSYGNTPSPQQTYGRQRMMTTSIPQQQHSFAQTVCSSYRMPVPNAQVGTPATPVHRFTAFPYGPGSGSASSMQPQCGSAHGGTPNGIAMCSPSPFDFQFARPAPHIVSPVAPPLPFGSPLAQRQQNGSQGLTPGPKPPGLTPGPVLKQPSMDGSRNASDRLGDLHSYTANCAARFEMMEWRGSNSDTAVGRNDGVNSSCP